MSPSPPAYENLDLELRVRLYEVVNQFEVAFLADPATRLEDFLSAAQGQVERAVLLLELLCVELECRRRAGQIPTAEEYLLRLPDDAETVQKAFRVPLNNLTGTRLGKYQLNHLIGRGGMGVVYAATDPVVKRQVAVKILSESLASTARAHEYLLREAQLVGQLLHPNIVTLFEAGEVDGVCFLALEYVSGGSAAAYLRQNGPFEWCIASRILLDVCQGLAAAHAVELIHRDIKPANVLLLQPKNASPTSSRSKLPLAKLTDFGLARVSEDKACVGTPDYMAPEQFDHGISNPTTDIYSVGATYHALLTGSPPFEARTLAELQHAHRTAPIPDVRKANPAIPETCARIIRRCLAKAPEERYQTAEQLIVDLESLLTSTEKPRPSRRRSLVLALAGAAILASIAGIVAVWIGTLAQSSDRPSAPISTDKGARAGPWEPLFNDRDFTGWQIRDMKGEVTPDMDAIFSVKEMDGEPTVWTSGRGRPFYLATVREYENFHLSLKYRWFPASAKRKAGVFYHCCFFPRQNFMAHEFALMPPDSGKYHHESGARMSVGILDQGRIVPGHEEAGNGRLRRSWENVPGEWNQLDLICVGDSALHFLNSRLVSVLARSRFLVGKTEKPLKRGRIMLQSHHGAIAYRRIRIRSINGIPPEFSSATGD